MWLKLEDFDFLPVRRKRAISADGSFLGSIQLFLLESVSEVWAWIFAIFGLLGLLGSALTMVLAIRRRRRFRATFQNVLAPKKDSELKNGEETEMEGAELLVPNTWDEDEIAVSIRSLQHKPPLLSVYLDHVRNRFISLQNERTAKKRVDFLKQELERAKLTKELATTINDLRMTGLNAEIAKLKLEIERDGLKDQKTRRSDLATLEHERDTLRIQVDITQSKRTIKELKAANRKPKELSSEELRERRKKEVRESIQKYEAEQQEITNDGSLSQESKRRQINIIDRRLEALHEELENLETV